jgi:predicted transport protein
MPIFKVTAGKLNKLNILSLDKEKTLQKLLEENLMEVLELRFLDTEYVTTFGGRIDTLAVDTDGAPVIIEYKRNKNDNVINQALSYLKWLKTQKPGFFEKLMIDKLGADAAGKIGLDWKNPRVVCIAESYSKFDIDTVEVVPLRIELWRYRYYEDGIFSLERINVGTDDAHESQSPVPAIPDKKGKAEDKGTSTVESLAAKGNPNIKLLFGELRERIRNMDEDIMEKATSFYVAYRLSKNFAEIQIQKTQINIHLRPKDYDDPKKLVQKIPDSYNWTMDRRVYLTSSDELDYVVGLIEQSYQNVL